MKKDLYEILGVSREASQDEIKKAYRKLAREHHPDVSQGDDSEERFKEVSLAYEVLSDPEKRRRYDMFGDEKGGGAGSFEGGLGDIFDLFFGEGFGMGGGGRRRSRAMAGQDLTIDLRLSFEEAVFGAEKTADVKRLEVCDTCKGTGSESASYVTCPRCQGSGQIASSKNTIFGSFSTVHPCDKCQGTGELIEHPCKECQGYGRRPHTEEVSLSIPAGITDNHTLRVPGKGEAGVYGGPPGDLFVVFHITEHEYFERRGDDLYTRIYLSFPELALGTNVELPLLNEKKTTLHVPPGTQSGTEFRVKAEGVPVLRGRGRGDLLVEVNGVTPTKMSREQRKAMEQLAQTMGIEHKRKIAARFSRS